MLSLISQTALDHIDHTKLIIFPNPINNRIILIEHPISMELVLLEHSFISLSILEILSTLAIKHPIMPITLVLLMPTLSEQHSPTTLHTVSELSLVPTSIAPPKSTLTVTLTRLELTLVHVALLTSPVVYTPTFFFVESELT